MQGRGPAKAGQAAGGTMRVLPAFLLWCLLPFAAIGQAPEGWQWSSETSLSGQDIVLDVAVDTATSTTYAVGSIEDNAGLLETLLRALLGSLFPPQYGGLDGTVLRYNATGDLTGWGTIGGTGADQCTGVCTDPSGNIYVTGYFSGNNATFGSGLPSMASAGGKDLFVFCMNPAGVLQWRARGGGTGDDTGTGIAYRNGKVYVTGTYKGAAAIAGSNSASGLSTTKANVFVAAYDATNGNGLWRVDAGNTNDCTSTAICADNDRVYVIGELSGNTLQVSNTSGVTSSAFSTTATGRSGFILGLRNTGALDWSAGISDASGNENTFRALGIDASPTGLFVTGSCHNGSLFPGNVTVNAAGSPHDFAYVARLNKNTGATTWVRTLRSPEGGSDHMQVGRDIAVDRHGDVLVTGTFRKKLELPNGSALNGGSDLEVFLAKFGSTGTFKWAQGATGNHDDHANGVSSDGKGRVVIGGDWEDEILFDEQLSKSGGMNIFVAGTVDLNFQVASYRDVSNWNGFGPICRNSGVVDLTTTYIPAQAGSAIAVHSQNSVTNPDAALGLNPGGEAVFDANGDWLIVDLGSGNVIPTGEKMLLRWRRSGGTAAATAAISASTDGVTFGPAVTISTSSAQHGITPVTFTSPARYIRIARTASLSPFTVGGVFDDLGTEPGGTWSGTGVSGTTFDPSAVTSGSAVLTYSVGTRSTSRTVIVNAVPVAGTLSGGGILCPGADASLSLTGHAGTTINWAFSTDNGVNWTDNTTNLAQHVLAHVTQTTLVRTTVSSPACVPATSATITITPQDNTVPVMTGGPSAINVDTDPDMATAVVDYTLPTVTDDCSTGIVAAPTQPGSAPGSAFPIGTTNVTLRATDAAGNFAEHTFTITVSDNQRPSIACPAPIVVDAASGQCSAVVNVPLPTATDNSGSPVTLLDVNGLSGSAFTVGVHRVLFRATDIFGNSDTCSVQVTVRDAEPPVIICPDDLTVPADPASCSAMVHIPGPLSITDNCTGQVQPFTTDGADAVRNVGTYTFTHTVADLAGNTASCSFSVDVVDATPPTIACPADISVPTAAGACGAAVSYTLPTAQDNCGGTVNVTAIDHAPGDWAAVGTTTARLKATDAAGNADTCSFTITVFDAEAPSISGCPADITLSATTGCSVPYSWTEPTVADNCTGATITRTAGPAPGSAFPIGTTTITYKAVDAAGRTADCSFTVTVNDTQPPTIQGCPAAITVDAGTNCAATATWTPPTVTDNCNGATITRTAGPAPGSTFPLGATTITYLATDAKGNTSTCSFTVAVNDVQPPTIQGCPAAITVDAGANCTATATWTPPTVTDNCSGATITRTAGPAPGSAFAPGTTTVTYLATDANGNTATCSFTVTVDDATPPVMTCPSDIVADADAGSCGANVAYALPTATDACSGASTVTSAAGQGPNSFFPVGRTTVQLSTTDAAGNNTSCSFQVEVVDAQPPVIDCPADIEVGNDPGRCDAVVTFDPPTATDNCGIADLTVTNVPTDGRFPVGSTVVQAEAIDIHGNRASCSFTVTVKDTEKPAIACPADIVTNADPGQCSASVVLPLPTATDNCTASVTVVATDAPANGPFPIGTSRVHFVATDAAGLTDTCSITVTVVDDQAPAIICPNDLLVEVQDPSACGANVTYPAVTATDNCAGLLTPTTTDPPSGAFLGIGTHTITYHASDGQHTSTCDFTITVVDKAPPAFSLGAAPTIALQQSCTGTMPDLSGSVIGATDCSVPVNITQVPMAGSPVTSAVTANITVRDALGNDTTVQMTLAVEDQLPPTVTCPATIVRMLPAGQCSMPVEIPRPAMTDNCGSVALTDSTDGIGSGSLFTQGDHIVTYTVADGAGHTATCSVDVTVLPSEPATLSYPVNGICADAEPLWPDVHMPSGGEFTCATAGLTLDAATGAIDPSTSSAGTYTIRYGHAGACSSFDEHTITIGRRADAGTDGTLALCSADAPVSLMDALNGTPETGGAWNNGAQAGLFDPATMDPGAFTYTIDNGPFCPASSATVTVTVDHQADATFSYPGTSYCSSDEDPAPDVSEAGGHFSGSAGLVIDGTTGTIDLDHSTPGGHVVRYLISGACADTGTFSLTIEHRFDAGEDGAITLCSSDAAMLLPEQLGGTPESGGTWNNGAQSDLFDPATMPSGLYTYGFPATAVCPASTATVSVTVHQRPDPGFTYAGSTYCSAATDPSPTVDQAGGTFTGDDGLVIDALTGTIDLDASTSGDHVVTYAFDGECPISATAMVSIDEFMPADAGDDVQVCGLLAGLPSTSAGTWSGPSEVTVLPTSGISASEAGIYTLILTRTNGVCVDDDSVTVTFDAMVTSDGGADVHVCGMDAVLAAAGTGYWSHPPALLVADVDDPASAVTATVAGTYQLTWNVVNGACSATDPVQVTFDAMPVPHAGEDALFCGGTGQLAATGTGTWTIPSGVIADDATDPHTSVTGTGGPFTLQWTVINGLCTATDEVEIRFVEPPQAGTDGTLSLCSDGAAASLADALTGADAGGTWTAPTGTAHGATYDPATDGPGAYTYTVQGPAGCPPDEATVMVTEMQAPDAGSDGALTLCANAPPAALIDGLNGTPQAGGMWTGPDGMAFPGTFDPALHAEGTYTYTIDILGLCTSSAQVTVSVTPAPDAAWTPPAPICSGSGLFDLAQLSGSGTWSGNGVTGTWFDPSGLDGAQTLLLTVTANGCSASASGDLTVIASPEADAGTDAPTCGLSFTLAAAPGTGTWSAIDGGAFASPADPSTQVDVPAPGTYRFIRTLVDGTCTSADTVSITFNTEDQLTALSAGDDHVQNIDRTAVLTGTATGATSAHWSIIAGGGVIADATALETSVQGLALGTNLITLSAQVGACPMRSDTVAITVNGLLIPEGFSPNGDGVNDRFEVVGIEVFGDNRLEVFNRWGQPVYTAQGYANQWDGRGDNGQELMDDTYFYVLKLDAESIHNGYLIIKR